MDILITDNGKEFRNQIMEELCTNHGITHRYMSPYHPQTDTRQNQRISNPRNPPKETTEKQKTKVILEKSFM